MDKTTHSFLSDLTMSSRKKASEATSNLRVAVRVRPMNATERGEKCTNVVKSDTNRMLIDLKGKPFGPFFRVYDQETTQADVYSDLVSSQVKKVIAGFNCTVFAYGQTGTGKTFTMEGGRTDARSSSDDPTTGIIPRAVEDIFEQLEASGCEEYSLRVSYVELYNEELSDLLASTDTEDRERLRIFDDPHKKGVIVSGVEEVPVRNRSDVFKLLKIGAEKRRTAATLMNMNSSRSHSLFMVNVVVRENTNTGEELVKQGKLNLVDLAGSENIGRSGAQGSRAKEAGSINQSLLTLGRVIRALTTNSQHVPYRESKLTRLLQDSLGGSTITSLIATLSPSSSNFEESQSTLEYAMRAANIKNKPVCNTKVSKKTILKEYSDEIEKLRRDLRAAREKNGVIISEESHEEFQKNTEKVHELEQQLDSVVDRLRRFTEDLMHMDEQYKQLYERKGELEDRLRERLREMAVKEKELADTTEVLDNHIQAIGLMHTASLNTFEQLRKTHDAAEEMKTDLSAFWRKVDEMSRADVKNKEMVEKFVQQMTSFIDNTSNRAECLRSDGNSLSETLLSTVRPFLQNLERISEDVSGTSANLNSTTSVFLGKAEEIEKKTSESMEKLTEGIRSRLEDVLTSSGRFFKSHAEKSAEWNGELTARMKEIKKQVTDMADDLRPLLTEIRRSICDVVEKRAEASHQNTDDVKTTISGAMDTMKTVMAELEKLTMRVEENHERQLLVDQSAQESVLSTINTAENVIQSLEDGVEEQCDLEDVKEASETSLMKIGEEFGELMETAGNGIEGDEKALKNLLNSMIEESNSERDELNNSIDENLKQLSKISESCLATKKSIAGKIDESAENLNSIVTKFGEKTMETTKKASEDVGNVVVQNVDPSVNVPSRSISAYPESSELVVPLDPEVLLHSTSSDLGEFGDDGEDVENADFVAKKKRRVTSYVRRDSLLDSTNVFMSPTSILKKREQAIEEEEEEI